MIRRAQWARIGGLAARASNYALGASLAWSAGKWIRNRRARRRIGYAIGTSDSKTKVIYNQGSTGLAPRVLQVHILDTIGGISATNDRSDRQTNAISLSGYSIGLEVNNIREKPIYFHWAVISPKGAQGTTVPNSEFFRGWDAQRGHDFDDAALSALERFNNPINSDRYNVIWHSKMRLAGVNDATGTTATGFASSLASYKTIKQWVPIRRQLRFESPSAQRPVEVGIYLIYWCDVFGAPAAPWGADLDAVQVAMTARVSFRDQN